MSNIKKFQRENGDFIVIDFTSSLIIDWKGKKNEKPSPLTDHIKSLLACTPEEAEEIRNVRFSPYILVNKGE